jgi:rod shape-determining protein MreD
MKLLFLILSSVLTLTAQSVLAPHVEIWGVRPDWILPWVIFLTMRARPLEALFAAWCIGLLADLLTLERLGLLSLTYLLVAAFVVSVRAYLFVRRAATLAVLTLLCGVGVQCAWWIVRRAAYGSPAALVPPFLFAPIYSAVCSWILHFPWATVARLCGFTTAPSRAVR